MVETADGPVDDGTVETEVNFRLPLNGETAHVRVADPANPGTTQAAAGYRDKAGDQPVLIRNVDPSVCQLYDRASCHRGSAHSRCLTG